MFGNSPAHFLCTLSQCVLIDLLWRFLMWLSVFSAFLISFLLPSLFCNSIRHYPFRDVCSVWVYSFSFSLILPLWIFTFHVLDCQGLAFAAKVWSPLVSLFWVILTRHFEFFMFWFDFLLWVIFLICCCVWLLLYLVFVSVKGFILVTLCLL